jgi:hypothetical protein
MINKNKAEIYFGILFYFIFKSINFNILINFYLSAYKKKEQAKDMTQVITQ